MEIKVWTLAWDLRHEGTGCQVFATEKEAWEAFIEKAAPRSRKALRLLKEENFEELSEYMQEQSENFLDTFEWPSEQKITVELPRQRVIIEVNGGHYTEHASNSAEIDVHVIDYDLYRHGDSTLADTTEEHRAIIAEIAPTFYAKQSVNEGVFDCPACGRHYDADKDDPTESLDDVIDPWLTTGHCCDLCKEDTAPEKPE